MAKRPIELKKRRRVANMLRKGRLPAYFNLVTWLIDHGYAKTKREAKAIILARRVRSDSHVIGVHKVPVETLSGVKEMDIVFEHVPVSQRNSITVSAK